MSNEALTDARQLRYFAASLTYNDTVAEGEAKHRLHEIAMRLETGYYTGRAFKAGEHVGAGMERAGRALASLPEGAPNPDSDHLAVTSLVPSSGGSVTIPVGTRIGQDFAHFDWPETRSGQGTPPADTLFNVEHYGELLRLTAPGFGERGAYGCGAIYISFAEWLRSSAELHAKVDEQRVIDGGENGEDRSTKGSKGAAIDEATKP